MGYVYSIVPLCGALILVYSGMNLAGELASGENASAHGINGRKGNEK